jgi:DNA-binding response OmpR family regulator
MRVLVVEDDRSLGAFLQKSLVMDGHEVDLVGDGDAALESAAALPPDLMVLDLALPRRDGLEVLEAMRGNFDATAILVLTGRTQLEDRVRCLDLGADDCMLKPFSLLELTARCRALLRRRERFADPILRFGGVEVNRMEHTVRYEGVRITLTVKEYLLLECLLQRQGACCSRAELLSQIWHATPDAGTNIVDVYVTYLRKKLAAAHPEEKSGGSAIETVRGSGYRLRDKRKAPRDVVPPVPLQEDVPDIYLTVELARGA